MHVEVEVYFFLFPGNYDNVSIGELAVQIFIQWIESMNCKVAVVFWTYDKKGCQSYFTQLKHLSILPGCFFSD